MRSGTIVHIFPPNSGTVCCIRSSWKAKLIKLFWHIQGGHKVTWSRPRLYLLWAVWSLNLVLDVSCHIRNRNDTNHNVLFSTDSKDDIIMSLRAMLRELSTNFCFLPPIRQIYKWQGDGKWYDISIATSPCHKERFRSHPGNLTAMNAWLS